MHHHGDSAEPNSEADRSDHVYQHFYRTPRLGRSSLSDGGGPFGFDITLALEVHWLIARYQCDGIVETGCHMGDTTDYLSRTYPALPVVSCDIVPAYCSFTRQRVQGRHNVTVLQEHSVGVVERTAQTFEKPFYFLDAHWEEDWPLCDELEKIERGIVCIHDFDIDHPRFAFDRYNGTACDAKLLRPLSERIPEYFVNNPRAVYPLPCLQRARRCGRAFLVLGLNREIARACPFLCPRDNTDQTSDS